MADYLNDVTGKTINVNGVSYPDRKILEITSPDITATDKPGSNTTELTFTGATGPTTAEDGYVAIASDGDLTYIGGDVDGYALVWNGVEGKWEPGEVAGGGGGSQALDQVLSVGNTTSGFDINLTGGSVIASTDGDVTINDNLVIGGNVQLNTPAPEITTPDIGGSTDSEDITIETGRQTGTGSTGNINLTTGTPTSGTGGSGSVSIQTAANIGATGVTGSITLATGAGNAGASGDVSISTGGGDLGSSGSISLTTGDGDAEGSGSISLTTSDGFSGPTGDIDITVGETSDSPGTLYLRTDNSNSAAISGGIEISTGDNIGAGDSGDISLTAGESTSGDDGNIIFTTAGSETMEVRDANVDVTGTLAVSVDVVAENDIRIAEDSVITSASNAGVGSSLVLPKSGNNLPFKGLIEGLGITFTESAADITISADVDVIASTGVYGSIYIDDGDSAETTIAATNTPVKVAGTTTAGTLNGFSMDSNNRLTYTESAPTELTIICPVTLSKTTSGVEIYNLYLYKNGSEIIGSKFSREMENIDTGSMTVITQVSVSQNDYIELWVENTTGTDNITASQMNMTAFVSGAVPGGFDYVIKSWGELVDAADGYDDTNEVLTLYDASYLIADDIIVPNAWKLELQEGTTVEGSAQLSTSITFDVPDTDGYGGCVLSSYTGRWAVNNLRMINTDNGTLVNCRSAFTSIGLLERCELTGLGNGVDITGSSIALIGNTRFNCDKDHISVKSASAVKVVVDTPTFSNGENCIRVTSGSTLLGGLSVTGAISTSASTVNDILNEGTIGYLKLNSCEFNSTGDSVTNTGTITGSTIVDNTFIAPSADDVFIGITPSRQEPGEATATYHLVKDNLWYNSGLTELAQLPESAQAAGQPSFESEITGTSYTLDPDDDRKTLKFNSASAQTLVIDPNSDTDIDSSSLFNLIQVGLGAVTISPGIGVTVNGSNDTIKMAGQNATGVLWQASSDEWYFSGAAFDEYRQSGALATPEGTVSGPVGAEYISQSTGRAWRKRTGIGVTGWQPEQPLILEADLSGTTLASGDDITLADGYFNDDSAYTIASDEIEVPQTGRYRISVRTEMNSSSANNAIGFDMYVGSTLVISPRGFDSAAANDEEVSIPSKIINVTDTDDKISFQAYVASGTVSLEECYLTLEGPL